MKSYDFILVFHSQRDIRVFQTHVV